MGVPPSGGYPHFLSLTLHYVEGLSPSKLGFTDNKNKNYVSYFVFRSVCTK